MRASAPLGNASQSPQVSVFEVSGISGPCFSSFHPSCHIPIPVALDQCISGGKYYLASSLPCLLRLFFMTFLLLVFQMLLPYIPQILLLFLQTEDNCTWAQVLRKQVTFWARALPPFLLHGTNHIPLPLWKFLVTAALFQGSYRT